MQVSKSWAVTITAFVCAILAPVVDGPLADYGIEISESDIEHFLYLMLGVGATGAAAKGGKKFIEKKTPQVAPQACLLYTSPSPRDRQKTRMPSSA